MNEIKTQNVVFYWKQWANPYLSKVKFGGNVMKPVNSVKFLGLHIDDHLIWHLHINLIVKVVSNLAFILFKLKYQLNKSSLLLIYNSLVYSNIMHYQIVWGFTNKILLISQKNKYASDRKSRTPRIHGSHFHCGKGCLMFTVHQFKWLLYRRLLR